MILILAFLNSFLNNFSIFLQILIITFNLLIFLVSLRENKKDLLNSHENLKDIENIIH